jgi:ABC-2 type transport system ATP-binding protein
LADPIFKINKLCKSYSGKTVLKNIDLEIMPGEIIGIIGASGSGKTTLLNTMIGFVRPDSGDVQFRLNHLLTFKDNCIYRSVYEKVETAKKVYGFASQIPSVYEELTVKENLEYFGILHNLSTDAIKANTDTLLSLMNLQYATNIQAKNLSGGMKRRLDIACSLMHDPEVLILDEPTSDLDPINRIDIWSLIKKINKKGTTIILSSHHLNELETLCDRIAILKDSHFAAVDKTENLKKMFVKKQEIIFESEPGNYKKIMRSMPKKYSDRFKIFENEARIGTDDNSETIKDLLSAIKDNEEKILSINVVKPSLDDVFLSILEHKEREDVE